MADEHTPLIAVVHVAPPRHRYPHSALRRFCTVALGSLLIAVVICFLIPVVFLPEHLKGHRHHHWSDPYLPSTVLSHSQGLNKSDLHDILVSTPDEGKAREWSQYYTAGPHLAGKNLSQALWTRDRWQEWGIKSEVVAYDIYINYPVDHRLALLKLGEKKKGVKEQHYKVSYECGLKEDVLEEDSTTGLPDQIPTFHGYSASGNVTAPYVYVNFGTFEDFEDLIRANVTLEGKIAIAKYGKCFRGLKTKRAQELGMIGIVLYTDPQEDGEITEVNGYGTYPNGPARNPSSVQRGSTSFLSIFPPQFLYLVLIFAARSLTRRSNNPGICFQAWCPPGRSSLFNSENPISPNFVPRCASSSYCPQWLWTEGLGFWQCMARWWVIS